MPRLYEDYGVELRTACGMQIIWLMKQCRHAGSCKCQEVPYKQSHIWFLQDFDKRGAAISDLIRTKKDKFLHETLQLYGKFSALSGWHMRSEKC